MSDIRGIGDRELTFEANKTSRSQMVTIEIDLTDPQDLLQKMELIDLTEEETDILIEKAMELNKKLRAIEKQDSMEKDFRSFTVSAPASRPITGHRGVFAPSSPRMSYRDNAVLQANSLARLQSGNVNGPPVAPHSESQTHRSSRGINPMKSNPYSYHSARPMRSKASS